MIACCTISSLRRIADGVQSTTVVALLSQQHRLGACMWRCPPSIAGFPTVESGLLTSLIHLMARARRAAAPHSDSSEREPSSDGSYTPPPSYKSKRSSRSTSASGGKGKAAVLARGSSEDEYTSTDSSASDVAGHSRAPRSRRLRGVGRGGRGKYEKVRQQKRALESCAESKGLALSRSREARTRIARRC